MSKLRLSLSANGISMNLSIPQAGFDGAVAIDKVRKP
jgi:hypothetical protein